MTATTALTTMQVVCEQCKLLMLLTDYKGNYGNSPIMQFGIFYHLRCAPKWEVQKSTTESTKESAGLASLQKA